MVDGPAHTPQWFRDEAQRCFRLASSLTNHRDQDALTKYGHELLDRADRMEAAMALANSQTDPCVSAEHQGAG